MSLFYLIPQMVGAGALVKPLFGLPHWVGVSMVGAVVMLIVITAGMVSTTYVQFLKGSLLVVFSTVLTVSILNRGLTTEPTSATFRPPRVTRAVAAAEVADVSAAELGLSGSTILPSTSGWAERPYLRTKDDTTGVVTVWWPMPEVEGTRSNSMKHKRSRSCRTVHELVNGLPHGTGAGEADFFSVGNIQQLPGEVSSTGSLGPVGFLRTLEDSQVMQWTKDPRPVVAADGAETTVFHPLITAGSDLLLPGKSPTFQGIRGDALAPKLNFLSLMLALFGGTASLPHILIRYYTVKDQAAARKSTVVGIGTIGFFYVLTLFMGLGAMTSGVIDVSSANNNMAAPLLAKSFGQLLFAMISAIAFTTVLGTVSGLIVAASGTVVHDLLAGVAGVKLTDHEKVRVGKWAAAAVGLVAIGLGIVFEQMNVNFLVGWAFSVAASANLPSLVMLLFWKRTTRQGITAAILVGMLSSLTWILASGDTYKNVYGLAPESAWVPFSQPGIVTIPLGFAVLVVVSLLTRERADTPGN